MTPEGKVKKAIKELLAEYKIIPADKAGAGLEGDGWYYMPVSASSIGVAGIPDFIGHYFGRFFAIEAKAPKKKPTGFQALQIAEIRITGGFCSVIDGRGGLAELRIWLMRTELVVEGELF